MSDEQDVDDIFAMTTPAGLQLTKLAAARALKRCLDLCRVEPAHDEFWDEAGPALRGMIESPDANVAISHYQHFLALVAMRGRERTGTEKP